MLPIVHRELRVAARSPKLYAHRLRWGVVQAIASWLLLLSSGGGFRRSAAEWFFSTLSDIALLLALLEGIRKTSDSVSLEKREGTLGLLFLSTLNGADVILGKFAGALIRSLAGLLTFIPILAMSLLVGGTTLGEFWHVALVLLTTLAVSLSLCLATSTLSREKSVAAGLTVAAGLLLLPLLRPVVPAAWGAWLTGPFQLLHLAQDFPFRSDPGRFWQGLAELWGLIIAALTAASLLVSRLWQERSSRRSRPAGSIRRSKARTSLLERNPVLWLAFDASGMRHFNGLAVLLLGAGILPPLVLWTRQGHGEGWTAFPTVAAAALTLAIYLRVSLQSVACMSNAKQDGALELLFSTPLTVEDVIKGCWLALWRTVSLPLICLLILLAAAAILAGPPSVGQAIWTSKLIVELLLEIVVLAAVGMWMGLRARSRPGAVAYTLLLGGLAPSIACIFTILIQIALILRGLDQVKTLFRRIRTDGCTPGFEHLLRRAPAPSPQVPPVIRH